MKFSVERSRLDTLFAQRNGYMVLALGTMMLCLCQLCLIVYMMGREKIILIPPSIEKSFWVSAQHVSPEYLSEMTTYFANLRLNVTPESASTQRESVLRYTDPIYYNVLKSQLVQEADRITDQHVSIAFYPVNMKVDAQHLKAIIEGDLKSFVGEVSLPIKRVHYLVAYSYDAGRLLIKSFSEVKHA